MLLEVDHIVPLHRGGAMWELANLATRCRAHHLAKTRRERRRQRSREPDPAWARLVAEARGGPPAR